MLIVGLNGSPRKNGNTAEILGAALAEAKALGADTLLLQVSEGVGAARTAFCTHCSSPCKGVCYQGTALEEMFNLLRRADAVIMGSPVYFGTVSAQLKAFWDKTRKLRSELALVNVVGAAVTVGGARFGGQEGTLRTLHNMLLVQGMILVGDGHVSADAGHFGVCAQQPAKDDTEVFKRVPILVRRVVEVARATESLRKGRRAQA
ncbi:flavodoxin family protein [Desulforudis sp. 1088]|uniref:flavodoxin family protein n=1 Tax=unclassified Candidatus Desulforudis TaxID=2635950 RepID=UPI003CE4A051